MTENNVDIDTELKQSDNQTISWTTRKRLSISAFIANILIICLLFFIPVEKISALKDIINTFLWSNVFLIIAYMSTTTVSAITSLTSIIKR